MMSSHTSRLVKSFTPLLVALVGIGSWYVYESNLCSSPIQYKLGTFDTGFGISKKDFLASLQDASTIWNKPFGKTFFEYSEKGNLTVNLIYDARQAATLENKALVADVDKIKNSADSVKQAYTALENEYNASKQAYTTELALYQQRGDVYSQQVDYWNSQGGAPEAEYIRLTQEQQALLTERGVLENKRLAMNSLADQTNAFVQKYNLLVQNANTTIHAINESAGKEFEEGEYREGKNEINIYEFSSDKKLTRVLTHELGHAIGLDHNDNPLSIMYPVNQANTLTLSEQDIEALKKRCKI